MFLGTPWEEPFRVLVWIFIGIPFFFFIIVPLIGTVLVVAFTALGLQVAIIGSVVGYLIGIPWSIWFRVTKGYWPEP